MIPTPYIQLLRVGLGTADSIDAPLSQQQWNDVMMEGLRQSVLGIIWQGIERLPAHLRPDGDTIAEIYGYTANIKLKNKNQTILAAKIEQHLRADGLTCCIIKGQGAARLYPQPDLRQSGDIDIWVSCGRERAIGYVRSHLKGRKIEARIHHVEFPVQKGTPIEIHYLPMFMYSFRAQKAFEKFCAANMDEQMNHAVMPGNPHEQTFAESINLPCLFHTPTPAFDAVFMLVHITRHLLEEGIGMRQLIDYYYVLKALPPDRTYIISQIQALGLSRMLSAVMYVMQEVLGMDSSDLIAPADKELGHILMEEITLTGAFGLYDRRQLSWKHSSMLHLFFGKFSHNLHFLRLCPEEVLSAPLFRIWHYCWRKKNGYM